MSLPFTVADFLDVFRSYNTAVWPAQILLLLLGVALVLVALRLSVDWSRRLVPAGLALLWFWAGAIYHLAFFAAINSAARLFGETFLLQAVLWLVWARRTPGLRFRPPDTRRRTIGAALLAYALLIYPLLNVLLGHGYPAMPTFGVPCPTTIASFGFLAWATPRPPWYVWIIPVLWALVGTSAAFTLGVREDLGLLAAAVLALVAQLRGRAAAAPA